MRVRIAISYGCVIDKGEGSLIFLSGWSPMGEALLAARCDTMVFVPLGGICV